MLFRSVNTAARLMQMAQPGELLLSRPVYDVVRGTLERQRVRFKGDVALRGRSGTIEVYSVTL